MMRNMLMLKKMIRMMDRMEETMPEVLALKISLAGKLWVVVPVSNVCNIYVFLSAKVVFTPLANNVL